MLYYLLFINIVSAILFCLDKHFALKQKRRIPERTLHLFELLGGVIVIIPLMYIIRHKNKKLKYYWLSYLILLVWIALFILLYHLR